MARGTGTVTVKFLGDTSGLKKATDDADGMLGKVGSAIGGAAKTAALVGVPALVGFGVAAVKAFSESEQVASQTEAVLKSTGGAAKVTADQVGNLAGTLSKMSGVDDEVIQSGENMLLTFTNIRNGVGKGNDIFNQTTQTMLDMSVALGQDTKQSAMQLGKALNDPIAGVGALGRVGVKFTDQQKDQIKALVESGKTMEAQKIILRELQTEFGGSAKAAGDTFAGQMNKLKVTVGNFMEDAGAKLVPILMNLANIFSTVIPQALEFVRPLFERLGGAISGLREGDMQMFAENVDNIFGNSGSLIKPIRAFMDFMTGDLLPTIKAVFAAITSWIQDHRQQIAAILNQVMAVFSSAFGAIQAVVTAAVNFLKGVWRVFGDDLISFAREAWAGITETFRGAFNMISGIFDLIKAVFTGKWGDAWTALKKIADGAWDAIFGLIRNAVTNVIPTLIAGLGQIITSVSRTVFDGLKDAFRGALNWIIDRWNGLQFKLPEVGFGPFKTPGFTLGVPNVPRLATGGTFNGAAIVGEAGPELIVGSGRVIPNNQLGGVQIVVNGALDPAAVARQIDEIMTRYVQAGGTLRFA